MPNHHIYFTLVVESDIKPQYIYRNPLKSVMRLNYNVLDNVG